MADYRIFLYLILVVAWQPAGAAWRAADAADAAHERLIYETNDTGQRVEIAVDGNDTVVLRLLLGDGFETFVKSNCPTFQIDAREPMHHFDIGPACVVGDKSAAFMLGQITDRKMKSLILHRLMNGNTVSFRYIVNGGQYRETRFSLRNSKQAFRPALGYAPKVDVD